MLTGNTKWVSFIRLCVVLVTVLGVSVASGLVTAQQATVRKLKIGTTVTGTFDARTFAQTYTFDGTKGDTVTLTATSRTRGLLLALLLTDATGTPIQQVAELTKEVVEIKDFKPENGIYYLTVLRATGVQGNTASTFTLTMAGSTVAPTQKTVTLAQGMTISLSWTTNDDLNLEVRDPIGGAINLNSPSATSGGRLNANVNGDCNNATSNAPTERIDWGRGTIPAGSYEVIVYFVKSCATGAVGSNTFTVNLSVEGKAQQTLQGTLTKTGDAYVGSFSIDALDQIVVRPGGVNAGVSLADFAGKINSAIPLGTNPGITGSIGRSNPGDVYSFEVAAAESVTIAMRAIEGGSLDPYLALLSPDGQIATTNDDENTTTRNALIAARLNAAGTYRVIATRFGAAFGGTEGQYQLTVTRSGTTVAVAPTAAPGTGGAITPVVPITTAVAVVTPGGNPTGSIQALVQWDSRADVRILIRDPQGRSLYTDRPRIDSGGILSKTGNLNCPANASTTPETYAYWNTARPPAGVYEVKIWQNSACNDTAPTTVTFTMTIGGTTFAPIVFNPPGDRQIYLTTFTVGADGKGEVRAGDVFDNTVKFDFNAELNSARQIVYNQAQAIQGEITQAQPYQLYTFTGEIGDKVTIIMRKLPNSVVDPYLFLVAPDGITQLAFNDDAGDNQLGLTDAKIVYSLTSSGTHTIIATRYGADLGGTQGAYRLQLLK
jgi:hypothetical protein